MTMTSSTPAPRQVTSLLLRLALAMGTITALAFVSMVSSVFFAEAMDGAAGAINQAGTLRMQSYRIAARLALDQSADATARRALAAEYDVRLASPRLAAALPPDPADEVRASYEALVAEWTRRIRPNLLNASPDPGLARRYLTSVESYVAQVDRFVGLLEHRTESKVRWLRLIHVVSLFLTLGIVALTMYMMHMRILLPLRELLACARQARHGDFVRRTPYETDDELGQLGRAFNAMGEDLSKMYAELEDRVRVKTADLERSNRSLELLYGSVLRLNRTPLSPDSLHRLLEDLETTTGVAPSAICLTPADGRSSYRVADTGPVGLEAETQAAVLPCPGCTPGGEPGEAAAPLPAACPRRRAQTFPIHDRDHGYGMLLVTEPPRGLEPWQTRLLQAVAAQIGTAITASRRGEQSRRLALLEERAVIARELHDSLAQSLSYLKIQASRLDAALKHTGADEAARPVLRELREGIASAYRQLRELLSTFRLRIDGRGLGPAIEDTVREFQDRNGIPISLDYRMDRCALSANDEIHVLQVVREALSNVVRHAQASQAAVTLAFDYAAQRVAVTIDDDGVGIPPSPLRTHHYGLAIMDERARSLGGELRVLARPEGGTRVELAFVPPSARERAPHTSPEATVHV